MEITKASQTRHGRKEKKKRKKKHNDAWYILEQAWKVQSLGLRRIGRCVGCGSTKDLSAGHLRHGGNGSAWRKIDFNCLTIKEVGCQNVFCQCSKCNLFDEDGNGMLKTYFDRYYTNEQYEKLLTMKSQEWKPTLEEAGEVLSMTNALYGVDK